MLLNMIVLLKRRKLPLEMLSLLLLGLLGCGKLAHLTQSSIGVSVINIKDIQKNHNAYSTVYLKGQVVRIATFVGSGAYELQDNTSSIWVITGQPLPAKGDEVLIKSQVQYQSIPIYGKDLGEVYVQEQEQIERKQPARQQ